MSSTFSNLKFELIGNGEQSGTWGTTTNSNIGTAIEQAIVGMATLDSGDFVANVCTLTLSNTTAAQDARALCLNISAGAVSAAGTINVPAIQKPYIVINGSSFAVTVKVSGLTGVAVPAGTRTVVYNNGTDVGVQINYLSSLTLGAALPVTSGGTGVTTSTGSGANVLSTSPTLVTPILGTPTSGTLTNATGLPLTTGVTGTLPVANGGTGVTTSTGTGNVVLSTSPTLVTPILGTPTSATLTNATGLPLTTGVTGSLPVANGGTGVTTSTGSGANVLSTSPTLVTPILGTPTSGTLTNATGLPLTTGVTGTLPIANGGSAATTAAAARTNFGATTLGANLFIITNPSAVTFPRFNADNTVSSLNAADFRAAIGAGSGGGSVTSVAGTGSANGLTLSGTVTSSGNITLGGSVTSLTTTNFTIVEESGKLVIKYGGTVVASFSSAGALISADNITAYGTP